jgi:CheY-like chemotaxis protein
MYPGGREILVVVNDLARRERIARILTEDGFAVTETAEGLAALRAVGSRRFSLIVADMSLPGSLDGLTTVRRARQRQPWLRALYTGKAARRPIQVNPDTDDFIAAPFERWELLGCTFELLQRGEMAGASDLARRVRAELRAS